MAENDNEDLFWRRPEWIELVLKCDGVDFWRKIVKQFPLSSLGRRLVLDKYTRDVMYFLSFKGKAGEVQALLAAYKRWKGETK